VIARALETLPTLIRDQCGLEINLGKTSVYPCLPDDVSTGIDRAIQQVDASQGVVVVGVPMGNATWVRNHVRTTLTKAADILPVVARFAHTGPYNIQAANLIMVRCVFQRTVYLARTVRPALIQEAATDFDHVFRTTLAEINDIQAAVLTADSGTTSKQAELPIIMGGLQWRRLTCILDAAFLGGFTAAARVAHGIQSPPGTAALPDLASVPFSQELGALRAREHILEELHVVTRDAALAETICAAHGSVTAGQLLQPVTQVDGHIKAELADHVPPQRRTQRCLTAALEVIARARLQLRTLSPTAASHMDAASTRGAYEFLTAIPWTKELSLTNRDMVMAIKRRLRLNVLPDSMRATHCNLGCRAVVTLDGAHTFVCRRGGRTQWRHDSVANTLIQCAKSAGVPARPATVADEDRPDKAQSKPDVVIAGITSQLPNNVDVTFVRVENTDVASDVAARVTKKMRGHHDAARRVGHDFTPFVVNGLGGLEPRHALALIRELAQRAAAHNIDEWVGKQFTPHWLARFSIVTQRLAANSLQRSMAAPSQYASRIGGAAAAADGAFDAYVRAAGGSLGH
jgi:hypothetical protein